MRFLPLMLLAWLPSTGWADDIDWTAILVPRIERAEGRIDWLEASIGRIDERLDRIEADVASIKRTVAEPPKRSFASAPAEADAGIVLLSAPFACAPCEAAKAQLQAAGKSFAVRIVPDGPWPRLLVNGIESTLSAVCGTTTMHVESDMMSMGHEMHGMSHGMSNEKRGLLRGIGRRLFKRGQRHSMGHSSGGSMMGG